MSSLFPELTCKMVITTCGYYHTVNHLSLVLQSNLDITALPPLQTASIFYRAIAGMELTGTVRI